MRNVVYLNQSSGKRLPLGPSAARLILMKTIQDVANAVVAAAGEAGGLDEVRRIAERGWPQGVDGVSADDLPEVLAAIQERARELVAQVDEGT